MTSTNRPEDEAVLTLQAAQAAIVLATLAVGRTTLAGVPLSDALAAIVAGCRGLGATVRADAREMTVQGVGIGGLVRPAGILDARSDPFASALLAGLAGGHDTGATVALASAVSTEVGPVLRASGATMEPSGTSPGAFEIRGARDPLPVNHREPLAETAAVAALVAALNAPGVTTIPTKAPVAQRLADLARRFGADLSMPAGGVGRTLVLVGRPELTPARIAIPDLIASVQGAS